MRLKDAVGLAMLITLVSAACSTGDSAEQYFTDLAAISTTLDTQLDDVEGMFNAGLLDIDFETAAAEAQLIELFQTSISGVGDSFQRLVGGLPGLRPSDELEQLHDTAVSAGLQVLAEYESRADQLKAMATLADIDTYTEELSATAARSRFVEACVNLQEIATRERINVDLNC